MARARVAATLLLLALAGCSAPAPEPGVTGALPTAGVSVEGAPPLTVEVASTPEQRAQGLMQRPAVAAGTGMLFVFPRPTTGGFWMKNTLVPLSIAYVDAGRVVSIAEMAPCPVDTPTCPSYPAAAAYTSAVEAPAGFFTAHRIGPGAQVTVTGSPPAPR